MTQLRLGVRLNLVGLYYSSHQPFSSCDPDLLKFGCKACQNRTVSFNGINLRFWANFAPQNHLNIIIKAKKIT